MLNLKSLFAAVALGTLAHGATITTKVEGPANADRYGTLDFAVQELQQLGARVPGNAAIDFDLMLGGTDGTPFSFTIQRQGNTIMLGGASPSDVLCAGYTALEEMGYRFEVTGPVAPEKLNLAGVPEGRRVITPAIQRRGIRQHINFDMDVSCYPIAEAKEYIRNLARLRYNYMTFHSYPCHWTRDRYGNRSTFADFAGWMKAYNPKPDDLVSGAYFYGGEYKVPNHPVVRPHVRFNKEYFCAPEFEDVIHTQPERGEKAQAWLRELMAEVKRCGMTLHFSTELKQIDDTYNQELADRILSDYPMIDLLEFNSQEGGDYRRPDGNQEMAEAIITGTDDAKLSAEYTKLAEPLCVQVRNYANCIRVIRRLQSQGWEKKHAVKLVCGSYATEPATISMEMGLAERYLPSDQILTIMPWYGSIGADVHAQAAVIKPEILKRLIVNSWLELDGFMMLQQQATTGLYDLAQYITKQTGDAPYGIVCNHWRTTPNQLSFRYLDELSFDAGLTPEGYFHKTAESLGIPAAEGDEFSQAMLTIDGKGDVRRIPGNLGFAIGWDFDPKKRSLGNISWWGRKDLESTRESFAAAHQELQDCRTKCDQAHGQAVLDELLNGTECSVEHLDGILELKTIADKYLESKTGTGVVRDNLTADEEAGVCAATSKADAHFQKYLELLANHAKDRGEEGMLITYYYGPVMYCHNIRAAYGKQGQYIERNATSDVVLLPLASKDRKAGGE